MIERCSGHDGTYAVKKEFHETSMKIGKPVMTRVEQAPRMYASDCPMAGHQIENGIATEQRADPPAVAAAPGLRIIGAMDHAHA